MAMIDRRVARTREALHRALMALVLTNDYEAITVEEICAAANVGRSTFYAHYTGKDDLRRSGLEHMRTMLIEWHRQGSAQPGSARRPLGFSQGLFEHARNHVDRYRALVGGAGGAAALATIRQTLADLVRDELAESVGDTSSQDIPIEIVVQYVAGAFMAVLAYWIEDGEQLPPEQIDAIFRRLATEGIPKPGQPIRPEI